MIVTNIKIKGMHKFGNIYYRIDNFDRILEINDNLLLFKGYIYPDINKSLKDFHDFVTVYGLNKRIKNFKGRYCGCFINKKENTVIIFNDQLGLNDIFFHFDNGCLLVSDKFTNILTAKKFTRSDIDIVSMAEFLLSSHVLRERTFIKSIKLLPIACMMSFNIDIKEKDSLKYWTYKLNTDNKFDKEYALNHVDKLFQQSIHRIATLKNGKNFTLGLSGGYDSRLAAKYACDAGMNLSPFVLNHLESDAKYIAEKLAKKMDLTLKIVNINNDYMSLKEKHLNYDPMYNIMYTTYCSGVDNIPEADEMLTGFFGGELFGNHIRQWDTDNRIELVDKIQKRLFLYNEKPLVSNYVLEEIRKDIRKYENRGAEDWQCCEVFEYENRQRRFVKNSPMFHFYGKFEQYFSIFTDIDLIEFITTFPLDQLFDRRFYADFYRRFHRELSKTRAERQPFSFYDSFLQKKLKILLMQYKFKILHHFGIKIPIFRTIDYLGHFDWKMLFQYCEFNKEFKDINIKHIYSNKFKQLPEAYIILKYHYLSLQYFINKYIDNNI